jgi:hypothetical protein
MRGTAWRIYLGIGALATGAYYLLPYDPAGAVLNVVVGASAVAAIAPGRQTGRDGRRPLPGRHPPRRRRHRRAMFRLSPAA